MLARQTVPRDRIVLADCMRRSNNESAVGIHPKESPGIIVDGQERQPIMTWVDALGRRKQPLRKQGTVTVRLFRALGIAR